MGVIAAQLGVTGLIPNTSGLGKNIAQQLPSFILIETDNTLAEVLVSGYLDKSKQDFQIPYNNHQIALVYTTDQGSTWLQVSVTGISPNLTYSLIGTSDVSSVFIAAAGSAAAPSYTFSGDLDTGMYLSAANTVAFSTGGTLRAAISSAGLAVTGAITATTSIGATTAVTAGTTVTAGTGITSTTGAITATAGAVVAGTTVTAGTGITSTTGAITATAGAVVAGTTVTAGTGITSTTGNIVATAGNVTAGSSGAAGTLTSFPATAANGSLIISALNAGGAFNTTIRNSVMGQSSVVSIPDPGAATSDFVLNNATVAAGSAAGSWGNAVPPTPTHVMTLSLGGVLYYVPLVAQNT